MGLIDNLQRKRPEVRSQYAFFGALAATSVIALIWMVSLPERFSDAGTVATDTADGAEPSSFFDTLGQQFDGAKDSVAGVLDALRNEEEGEGESDSAADPAIKELDIETLLENSSEEPSPPRASESGRIILIGTSSAAGGSDAE